MPHLWRIARPEGRLGTDDPFQGQRLGQEGPELGVALGLEGSVGSGREWIGIGLRRSWRRLRDGQG
jgi:hypothetical protein